MFVIFLSTPFFELFTIWRFGWFKRYKYLRYSLFSWNLNNFYIIWDVTCFTLKLFVRRSDSFSNLGIDLKKPTLLPSSESEL